MVGYWFNCFVKILKDKLRIECEFRVSGGYMFDESGDFVLYLL